jgi:hypothetical protein
MIMATITFSSHTQQNPNFFEGLRADLVAFAVGVKEGLDMARSYNVLSHMSEDELRKRGLTRSGIARAVVAGYTVR